MQPSSVLAVPPALTEVYQSRGHVDLAAISPTPQIGNASNQRPIHGNFLEDVVGVSLADARQHLHAVALDQIYDLGVPPTKEGPAAYVAVLRAVASGADQGPAKNAAPRRTLHVIDAHLSDSVMRAIATSPALGEVVARLTGWAAAGLGARLLETQVWMKPPSCTVPLTFHRDTPYFDFLSPLDICTVWLTFDDMATPERAELLGGLEYAVGSHRWPQAGGIEGVFFEKDYRFGVRRAAAAAGVAEADIVVERAVVPAGGAAAHNGMLWHGSGANRSPTEWRRGLGIHYVRSDACFRQEFAEGGEDAPPSMADVAPAGASRPPRRTLSRMWAPHKQPGTLALDGDRFPIVWGPAQ